MNLVIKAGHAMPTGGEIHMSQYGGYRVTHRYTGQHENSETPLPMEIFTATDATLTQEEFPCDGGRIGHPDADVATGGEDVVIT